MKEFLSGHIPLPERVREKKIRSMAELLKEMPGIEWVIEATEQERQKPKDAAARKGYDSGRKKRHRIKSPIVVEKGKGFILDGSSGWMGSIHDLRILEGSGVVEQFAGFQVKGWTDKGYFGIEEVAKGWEIEPPKKKPKGGSSRKRRGREIGRSIGSGWRSSTGYWR